jgi:hypothetical protein
MLCAAEMARKDERRVQTGISIVKSPYIRMLESFEYDAQPSAKLSLAASRLRLITREFDFVRQCHV